MKYSLLDMTQTILSSLDSDEVNTISDTVEARQVAKIIRTAYYNIAARADLPETIGIFPLDASGDNALPTLMYRPEFCLHLEWIKYDVQDDPLLEPVFEYVTILPHQQFQDYVHGFNADEDNVGELFLGNFRFFYKNDIAPHFCTIIGDRYVVFDSYNNLVDSTLQSSKTLCCGQSTNPFIMDDAFIPQLDDQQFPLLLNEAKSLAFLELKQMPHQKAEVESRRQWRTAARTKSTKAPNAFDALPNFARAAAFRSGTRPHVTS